tara:strand:- start:2985 stop:3422 length:438 start_codon:yes stop_codon:yes gene_type:complete
MTDKDFIQLKKQTCLELLLTEETIKDKILKAPILKAQYYNLYLKEKKILDELDRVNSNRYSNWMKYYKFRGKHPVTGEECPYVVNTQKELDHLVYSNKECNDALLDYDRQQDIVDYIKNHLKNLNDLGFSFNQYLEYQKLQQGLR